MVIPEINCNQFGNTLGSFFYQDPLFGNAVFLMKIQVKCCYINECVHIHVMVTNF